MADTDDLIADSENNDISSMGNNTKEKLGQLAARIERLEAEKTELTADIREVYAEVKSFGFDSKILRKAIAARKKDAAERAEEEQMLELYLEVIGIV